MLMMEFMKASCCWEMYDEMEREAIRLWRAAAGHLIGRPWMVRRILWWVRSRMFSLVLMSDHNSESWSMMGIDKVE